MIVDHEALMLWAKEQAPGGSANRRASAFGNNAPPVRLEISAEEIVDKPYSSWTQYTARVFLARPGCKYMNHRNIGTKCECGIIAEKRLS
jgi:hypothetical protein